VPVERAATGDALAGLAQLERGAVGQDAADRGRQRRDAERADGGAGELTVASADRRVDEETRHVGALEGDDRRRARLLQRLREAQRRRVVGLGGHVHPQLQLHRHRRLEEEHRVVRRPARRHLDALGAELADAHARAPLPRRTVGVLDVRQPAVRRGAAVEQHRAHERAELVRRDVVGRSEQRGDLPGRHHERVELGRERPQRRPPHVGPGDLALTGVVGEADDGRHPGGDDQDRGDDDSDDARDVHSTVVGTRARRDHRMDGCPS
jgi:hypothetical protein